MVQSMLGFMSHVGYDVCLKVCFDGCFDVFVLYVGPTANDQKISSEERTVMWN